MIITTNDVFQILDHSENVIKNLNFSPSDWSNFRERVGEPLNLRNILCGFDDIMNENLGQNNYPPKDNLSLVNAVVCLKTYDNISEQFEKRS